jgi:uncharacterized protein (TIGR04255 family)
MDFYAQHVQSFGDYMRFPHSDRVKYARNPLVEVICQLRFPRILRIEIEPPADFQEALRPEYPRLNVIQSLGVALPLGTQAPSSIGLNRAQTYEFLTRQDEWKLVLASDFLALSTTKYTQWEEFRERLVTAINVLVRCYAPSHFTRIGLRYQDVIIRSELGLQSRHWRELLQRAVVGLLAAEELSDDVVIEAQSVFACRLDHPGAIARVRHGLSRRNGSDEFGYLIDVDLFSEEATEVGDAIGKLDLFNREAGYLFRWCITEELHRAMEPRPLAVD